MYMLVLAENLISRGGHNVTEAVELRGRGEDGKEAMYIILSK
jgi:hypothetical protein